jgi:hypothetical protein
MDRAPQSALPPAGARNGPSDTVGRWRCRNARYCCRARTVVWCKGTNRDLTWSAAPSACRHRDRHRRT